ncbi:ribonuclease R [Floccifex sp.]|uniref:ribonuclease R n=1 Tax=Floccifex sp. TaxID=2815810 RepID=UPI003F102721
MRQILLQKFHQQKKWNIDQLRKTLNIKNSKELTTLVKTLNELVDERLIINNHTNYILVTSQDMIGKIKDISKTEYAIINEDKKIYVEKKYAKNVFDGDEVFAQRENGNWKVKQIFSHGIHKIIGEFIHSKKGYQFFSDIDYHRSFIVKNIDEFKIQNHDKAVVRILKYDNPMLVEIETIVGNKKEAGVDITSILYENNVRMHFNERIEKECKTISSQVTNKDKNNRVDLTNLITFTIDGDDAKDFDDAISITKKKYGYTLYVHIADVSHYVKEGSAIDQEAYARCTSIYVCDRVVPMLPFELSNGICSLNPEVDRCTITCQMEIDEHGNCTSYKVYPSLIHSNQRCTYNMVNAVLKGNLQAIRSYENIYQDLIYLAQCASLLQERSYDRGCIDFNTKEPEIQLNKKGKPISIRIKPRGFAQQMIEECMILANVCVANLLHQKHIPCMYRIHEKPTEKKLEPLIHISQAFHYVFDYENISSKTIQTLLESIEDVTEHEIISRISLRSMQKAIYNQECKGHFGLSLEEYCHFTSPIRRYSDLVVHRMLRKYIFEQNECSTNKDEKKIMKQSIQMSQKERDAIFVERQVNDYKMAEYMENQLFKTFDATIISVMEFGFFVELENGIEGLVPIRTLFDHFVYDELTMTLKSESMNYSLGQKIKVICTEVNKQKGQITFNIA